MKYYNTGAIIVAAGLSSRMNGFKPLMDIGDKTMIETTINNFRFLGLDNIVIVTGYRSRDIEKKLEKENINVKTVQNYNYESTYMFDSVCIGLRELINVVGKVFVTPVDNPFVQHFTLKKMIEEMDTFTLDIVQPSYKGKNGHPLLLSSQGIDIMLKHDGYMGMKGAIPKFKKFKNISFADPGIILDADNKFDYLKLLKYYEQKVNIGYTML